MDEFDDIDEFDESTLTQDIEDDSIDETLEEPTSEEPSIDIIGEILKDKGINKDSIKFENEEGNIEERTWNDLSTEEQLEILKTEHTSDFDDSEIRLINAIRQSNMTPEEYVNYIQKVGVDNYISNAQIPKYQVDDLSDDDLFMTDVLAKLGTENITSEELADMLINAKKNESLYKKQIELLRNDYRTREQEDIKNQQLYAQQEQVERFNAFAETVENEIRSFTDLGGYELNMSEDEMEEVYDFITGYDEAGVSIFSKALNDPKLLVRMAWFALNGDKAISDINDYWTSQIKTTRRKDKVTVKQKPKSSNDFDDDLDDW